MANELHTLSIGGNNYPIRPFKMTTEGDNRSVATTPSDYSRELIFKGLKYNNIIGSPSSATYSYLFGLRGWSDNSGGNAHEIAFNDNGLYRRQGASTEWGAWAQILDSSNYTSYLNIAPVLKYHGITTTALTDDATTNPIVINGSNHTPEVGCTVFYENKEFVWNGEKWEEFGYPFALNVANTTTLGGVKPWFYNSVAATGVAVANARTAVLVTPRTSVVGRYYGVEMDVNGRMHVNVPWIGYTAGTGISISSDNVITADAATPMFNVTYEELKELRDNAELVAGQQYRITDYITTTTQSNTVSANHQFDIIVTADNENTLNEKARACLHEGDAYFADSDLNAWKIWYCLDNDTDRFSWANTATEDEEITEESTVELETTIVQGSFNDPSTALTSDGETFTFNKSIAYITHYNNTYTVEQLIGTTTTLATPGPPLTAKVSGSNNTQLTIATTSTLGKSYFTSFPIEVYTSEPGESYILYAGKGVIYRMIDERGNDCPYDFKNIKFKHPEDTTTYPDYYYTFTTLVSGVVSDHSLNNSYCYSNVIKEYFNLRDSDEDSISLNNNVFINTSSMSYCNNNSFGNGCYENSFGNGCYENSFGNGCYENSFGNGCYENSFGNNCFSNSFGTSCCNNIFGTSCYENSFGGYFYRNSFGLSCVYNIFGNSCNNNSFGNNCFSNSFGNSCNNNSFGNSCNNNSFGNSCINNNFGNDCDYNSFRLSESTTATLLNYCQNNTFDDDCSYIVIWNSTQPTSSNKLQNIKVDKSASTTTYVYYNVTTFNSVIPIFVSREYKHTTTTTSIPIGLYNSGTAIDIKVYSNGVSVTPSKQCVNAAGGFYETSDERLKNFLDDVTIDLEKLSSLRKKYFTWKDGHGDQQLGVSAQEVQLLYPELVNEEDNGNLSVDYAKLSVVALSAVDKLYNRQKDFEDKLAKIEKALNL